MSQPKYKVRFNSPKPSENEIKELKNFNRILHQYKRAKRPRPLHSIVGKINRLIPIIIIVLSLLLFLFYYIQLVKQHKKEQELPKQDTAVTTKTITPASTDLPWSIATLK